jgi:cytochrome c peroxidase
MRLIQKSYFYLMGLAVLFYNCGGGADKNAEHKKKAREYAENTRLEQEIGQRARSLFQALPALAENPANEITAEKITLGKQLYFDVRLSRNQTQSCNTCHDLSTYGVDNKRKSQGDEGEEGDRNSPTVLNAALHAIQFWDGRAKDVEEQAGMPVMNPEEMNIPDEDFLIQRLKSVDAYQKMFASAFPENTDPVSFDNIEKAIGAFERTLIIPSKFDDYLKGNADALSLEEKQGLKTFMEAGCITCHTGSLLGGNMFQKFGIHFNYWEYTKSDPIDEGRASETRNEMDKYMFKVPSLRNVTRTHPYFHDGSVETLEEAVKIIAKVNLNKDLTDDEVAQIVVFLNALTGELPAEVTQAPESI